MVLDLFTSKQLREAHLILVDLFAIKLKWFITSLDVVLCFVVLEIFPPLRLAFLGF